MFTMQKNKILILAASILILGLNTSCIKSLNTGAEDETTSDRNAPVNEHMDISIALWNIGDALQQEKPDPFRAYLFNKFNITIHPENITWDDYARKNQIWAASQELPDVFSTDAANIIQRHRGEGYDDIIREFNEKAEKTNID